MSVLPYIPMMEMLFINLFTVERCCHRKYSVFKTFLALFLFSSVVIFAALSLAEEMNFRGDGRFCVVGFIFLIPLCLLYQEHVLLLAIIMCTCWVYTLGVLSLSLQISGFLAPDNALCILIINNLLYLATLYPFYRTCIPKYVFVIENLHRFQKYWYPFITFNNTLNFLTLLTLNFINIQAGSSLMRILLLCLLLISDFMSFCVFYKVAADSIKITELELAASYDPLTGIGNRSHLWSRLENLIATNQIFSLLFMDLDHFKQINDQYGHIIGDQYLRHFAKTESSILGESGTLYRFGGDEFVAICPGTVNETIIILLKECQGWKCGAPCPFNQVSIGTLLCEPPHQTAEQILHQVDQLMYLSKQSGTAVFSSK